MNILISGAGIAGPTLAYWLLQYGFEPTIVEAAPKLRGGGYVIDFWGAGFDIAEKMGLLPEVTRAGYKLRELRVVNESGKRTAGFPVSAFFRMTKGRYASLPRSDLAAFIFHKIEDKAEAIFGDTIDRIEQTGERVHVTFRHAGARDFDLVIGADGLHSRVRELAFGPEAHFEKYLGYKAAAFQVEGYTPRDELVYVLYTQVGQQVGRFSMRDNRTLFLFTFADDDPDVPSDVAGQKAQLRRRFGTGGWECPRILDAMERAGDLYIDRVSQIRMDPAKGTQTRGPDRDRRTTDQQPGPWARGRVALVGDAAFCVSLLAGQGSALAMIAAYILAGELRRANGNCTEAFARYQNLFEPFVRRKQKAALRFAGSFAPKSKFSLFLRNRVFDLLAIPGIADLAIGRDLADKISLPDY
jgi:2-polyprenyl-6-methoxyphenol hydroxylase-like FAD-dependent oxidoreductase